MRALDRGAETQMLQLSMFLRIWLRLSPFIWRHTGRI